MRLLPLLLLLAACSSGSPGTPTPSSANGWSWWSAGAFGGVAANGSFTLPIGDPSVDHVDYVTEVHTRPLTELTVTYTITGSATLSPNTTGFSGCGDPELHLFFAIPNYTVYPGPANFNTQRWWSVSVGPMTPGQHTLTVPVTPDQWSDVNGQSGAEAVANSGFLLASTNPGSIGITFGSHQCAAGHGVSASGPVTFTINNLAAQ